MGPKKYARHEQAKHFHMFIFLLHRWLTCLFMRYGVGDVETCFLLGTKALHGTVMIYCQLGREQKCHLNRKVYLNHFVQTTIYLRKKSFPRPDVIAGVHNGLIRGAGAKMDADEEIVGYFFVDHKHDVLLINV